MPTHAQPTTNRWHVDASFGARGYVHATLSIGCQQQQAAQWQAVRQAGDYEQETLATPHQPYHLHTRQLPQDVDL